MQLLALALLIIVLTSIGLLLVGSRSESPKLRHLCAFGSTALVITVLVVGIAASPPFAQ